MTIFHRGLRVLGFGVFLLSLSAIAVSTGIGGYMIAAVMVDWW